MPPGHKMTFKDALHTVSVGLLKKMALPKIAMKLFPSLRIIDLAFDELEVRSFFVSSESSCNVTYWVRST